MAEVEDSRKFYYDTNFHRKILKTIRVFMTWMKNNFEINAYKV